jgi:hypothetical protein
MMFQVFDQRIGRALLATAIGASGVACSDRSHEVSGTEVAQLSGERGLDYAWSRPSSPQDLRAAGYTFVVRYLSYDTTGKNLTANEAQGLLAAGIDIVSNWEWGANDALQGYSTGRTQAQQAQALAAGCGMPPGRPIYFSVDFDVAEAQQAAINDYFDGVASVLGIDGVGAYGGYYAIQRLFDAGKIRWGWQTYAWSGGQWEPRAQLRQIQNDVTVAGAAGDIDQSVADDFGQWGPGAPSSPPPPPPSASAEGSQAFLYPNQQHYLNNDGHGNLRHHWWDATSGRTTDTWGTGIAGQPVTFVDGTSQHIFARGSGSGSLEHWFWDPAGGAGHNTWAPSGLAGDPAAIVIGDYQDVWAVDNGNNLRHWYWGPQTNGVQPGTWGAGVVGRPTVFLYGNGEQHAFAQGTTGTLEHWWWTANTGVLHDTWGSGLAGDPASLAVGEFQDVWAVDGAGNLQQWYWGPNTGGVKQVTWSSGPAVVGRPGVMLAGAQQHAFVRGTGGTLEHWWWDPQGGIHHDTWGSGIVGDPTAEIINDQQHVWALDAAGHAQHWYWDPATNMISQDDWGL